VIESIVEDLGVKKHLFNELVARVTRAFSDAGIMVHAYLMYASDGDRTGHDRSARARASAFRAGCIQ